MEIVESTLAAGYTNLKSGNYVDAVENFRSAFNLLHEDKTIPQQQATDYVQGLSGCWLLLHAITAFVRAKNYEDAYDLLHFTFEKFGYEEGFLVGNPWFHFLCGQIKYELSVENTLEQHASGTGSPTDEFARALITGGMDIFQNENPDYLSLATSSLSPPAGFTSWEQLIGQRSGCNLKSLENANGFLRQVFIARGLIDGTYTNNNDASDFPSMSK